MNSHQLVTKVIKPLLFVLSLVPLALLVWRGMHHGLGANPVEKMTHVTGDWTLRLLLITLAVTPLRKVTGWHALIRVRRMLGLYAFFYACLHFSVYLVFDHFFDLQEIARDVIKHPYVTVGFASFVLLFPLAATSTNKMVKRLGGARWQRLHKLVYVIATGGVLHYLWLVKADTRDPVIYGVILALLLMFRVVDQRKGGAAAGRPQAEVLAKARHGA
jgi:sulfoxide reductase heme-binding subunit YedZ